MEFRGREVRICSALGGSDRQFSEVIDCTAVLACDSNSDMWTVLWHDVLCHKNMTTPNKTTCGS